VETASFGAELVAGKTAVKQIQEIRLTQGIWECQSKEKRICLETTSQSLPTPQFPTHS
jgi:hypothetical protein